MSKTRDARHKKEAALAASPDGVLFSSTLDLKGEDPWKPKSKRWDRLSGEIKKPRRKRPSTLGDVGLEELREVLGYIENEDLHFNDWLRVGMAIESTRLEEGLDLWIEWSSQSAKHRVEQCVDRWPSFSVENKTDPVTVGSLKHLAMGEGWRPPKTDPEVVFAEVIAEHVAKRDTGQDSVQTSTNVQGDSPSDRPGPNGSPPTAKVRSGRFREPALAKNQFGTPTKSLANVLSALRVMNLNLRLDEFANQVRVLGVGLPVLERRFPGLGRVYRDDLGRALRATMMSLWSLEPPLETVREGVRTLAMEKRFNPITEWLDSLKWDGVPRLDSWLVDYCGAPDKPYERAVGRILLMGAVARAYTPGVKFDSLVILEGDQGTGKSTLIQIIGGEYASEGLPGRDVREKDALEAMRGKWIIEFGEMETARKADIQTIKHFLSRRVDRWRPPYGHEAEDFPRRCIFIGTTNEDDYLRDSTGNRRMLPVRARVIDLDGLTKVREQLLAEAAVEWKKDSRHECLFMPRSLWGTAAEEVEKRYTPDPWEEAIRDYIAGDGAAAEAMDRVTGQELLEAVGVSIVNSQRQHLNRVGSIMRRLGWKKAVYRVKGKNTKGYLKLD